MAPALPSSPRSIRFGVYELDLQAGELRRQGVKVKLQEQPFQILQMLLEHPGEVVTREEIQQKLWPADTFVDFEHGINAAVKRLREALDDSADNPRFIETLARRGYRFIAPVSGVEAPVSSLAGSAGAVRESPLRRGWVVTLGGVAAGIAVIAGVAFWLSTRRAPPVHESVVTRIFPLTGSPGLESDPAFSPDGKQLAYVWDGGTKGNSHLYVELIGAGRALRLTSSEEKEGSPTWSPDGRFIALLRQSQSGADVYIVPALGGAERRVAHVAVEWWLSSEEGSSFLGLSWSPDGKLLAVPDKISAKDPFSLFLVSVEDGAKRKLTSPPAGSFGDVFPAFSPDGRAVVFARWASGNVDDLYFQALAADGTAKEDPVRLTFGNTLTGGPAWMPDGREILFQASTGGHLGIWQVESDTRQGARQPQPVPVAAENSLFPTVARQGNWLAFVKFVESTSIHKLDLQGSSVSKPSPQFCPSSEEQTSPQFSPDGNKVAFDSGRSGNIEIWICDSDGSQATQLTSLGSPLAGSPRWSPDGKRVAFDCLQGAHFHVWIVDLEGRRPRRITPADSEQVRPIWSNDGKWVYFGSDVTGDWQTWKIPSEGGAAVQVTKHGGYEACESPDARFLYYVKNEVPGIWRMPIGGSEESRILDKGQAGLWVALPQGIYFLDPSSRGGPAVEFFNFATRRLTRVLTLPKDTRVDTVSPSLAVSPDEKTILFGQVDFISENIMVVENFR